MNSIDHEKDWGIPFPKQAYDLMVEMESLLNFRTSEEFTRERIIYLMMNDPL